MKTRTKCRIAVIAAVFFLLFIQNTVAESVITIEFYYNPACGTCRNKKADVIDPLIQNYSNNSHVIFYVKDWRNNDTYREEYESYNFTSNTGVAINHEIILQSGNITFDNLEQIINELLAEIENESNNTNEGFSLIDFLREIPQHIYLITIFVLVVCILGALVVFAWRKEKKKE